MNELLIKYQRTIDKLPSAAKSAILAMILILIFIFWHYALWQNLHISMSINSDKIKTLNLTIPNLKIKLQDIENNVKLKQAQKSIDQNKADKLLSPTKTSDFLYKLITTSDNLTLLQLKNVPPKTVVLPQSNMKIFEHGIMIKFQGDYFSTMNYLQAVEKLKWKIFWDKLEYKVTQYPVAEITLYVHTINDYEG